MARTSRPGDHPTPIASAAPPAGVDLTAEERLAILDAAAAEGYSDSFADLLCRFAELIGTDEVLCELKKMEPGGH